MLHRRNTSGLLRAGETEIRTFRRRIAEYRFVICNAKKTVAESKNPDRRLEKIIVFKGRSRGRCQTTHKLVRLQFCRLQVSQAVQLWLPPRCGFLGSEPYKHVTCWPVGNVSGELLSLESRSLGAFERALSGLPAESQVRQAGYRCGR